MTKRQREDEDKIATSQAQSFQELLSSSDWALTPKWPYDAVGSDPLSSIAVTEDDVPYSYVADVLADISATAGRNDAARLLAIFFLQIRRRAPSRLVDAVYLTANRLAPAHEGLELGIGDSLLSKVVGDICGLTEKRVKEEYQRTGDLAEVAQEHKQRVSQLVKGRPLTLKRVISVLRDIANVKGNQAQQKRGDLIRSLLRDAQGPETNLLIRALQGRMRIGVAELTVVAALGHALVLHYLLYEDKEGEPTGIKAFLSMPPRDLQLLLLEGATGVARLYNEVPSYDIVLDTILRLGYCCLRPGSTIAKANFATLTLRPGLPVRPQLANPTSGITAVLDRLEGKAFTCEYKYDGERAQIHYSMGGTDFGEAGAKILLAADGTVVKMINENTLDPVKGTMTKPSSPFAAFFGKSVPKANTMRSDTNAKGNEKPDIEENSVPAYLAIFSRNSETHTRKYPDIIGMIPNVFNRKTTTSFILDSEVVAIDEATGKIQNFQTLQHRGRKNINAADITIKVCVFVFDLLYYNGESLLLLSLEERRQRLKEHFSEIPGQFQFAQSLDSESVEEVQEFLDQAIADGAEGLMVKTLRRDAQYVPARRTFNWLKLKKDYMDGATDTLDLVPIGAFHGKGKRTGVFGGFLLACFDPDTEEYQSICKLGTGLSDAELESLTTQLTSSVTTTQPRYYRTLVDAPDVWLEPSMVWEVKAADLSLSPVHMAAIGKIAASPGRGVALRFPRFLRVREDKSPTDATSAAQVAHMYQQQALAAGGNPDAKERDDEDAYY